jgi:hypothetical protein
MLAQQSLLARADIGIRIRFITEIQTTEERATALIVHRAHDYSAKLRTIDSDPFVLDESTAARKAD